MLKKLCLALLLFVTATAVGAQTPSYLGRYESSAEDTAAILQVTKDFQSALIRKDGKALSALLLDSKILLSSPASPARVRKQRDEADVHFDGIDGGGAQKFIDFVSHAKETVEEKFYNLRVTQDRHVAWVLFDFEFLEDNKVGNYGVEGWQLVKTTDGSWKILSIVWSSHGTP